MKRLALESSPMKTEIPTFVNSQTKHLEDIREFKKSVCYKALEQAVLIGEDIRERDEELEGFRKLELESDQGSSTCRSFLVCVERLFQILAITPVKKEYRLKFSKAYKVLYQS